MTCAQCRHEFCWICMGNWTTHGSATGGYYKCNVYETKVTANKSFAAEEVKRAEVKNELERYLWFFERYTNHDKSARFAANLLLKLRS